MNISKDVRELISLNERIQSAVLQGEIMTPDEATLIRECAIELLRAIPAPNSRVYTVSNDGDRTDRS